MENLKTDFFVRNCRISHLNILALQFKLAFIGISRPPIPSAATPGNQHKFVQWRIRFMKSKFLGCLAGRLAGHGSRCPNVSPGIPWRLRWRWLPRWGIWWVPGWGIWWVPRGHVHGPERVRPRSRTLCWRALRRPAVRVQQVQQPLLLPEPLLLSQSLPAPFLSQQLLLCRRALCRRVGLAVLLRLRRLLATSVDRLRVPMGQRLLQLRLRLLNSQEYANTISMIRNFNRASGSRRIADLFIVSLP
jgi:hypothetical protein